MDESLESPQKRAPGCLGYIGYIGDYTTQLCGDYPVMRGLLWSYSKFHYSS